MAVIVRVGQLRVAEGARQPPIGNVQTVEARRGSNRSTLYFMVDGVDPAFAVEAAQRLREAYLRVGSPSVVTGLSRALREATTSRRGRRPDLEMFPVDAIAVAQRGEELHIARVGDSRAFLFRHGREESLPTHPLSDVGGPRPVEVGHCAAQPGDFLLLLGRDCPLALVPQLSSFLEGSADPQQILEDFHRSCRDAFSDSANLALLAVEEGQPAVGQPAPRLPVQHPRRVGRLSKQPGLFGDLPEPAAAARRRWAIPWPRGINLRRYYPVASLIVIVAVLALLLSAVLRDCVSGVTVPQLLERAEAREQEAERSTAAEAKRRLLVDAERDAREATARAPEDRGARAAHARIRKQLEALDAVVTPAWATRLVSSAGIRQVALQGDDLYVLDVIDGTLARYRITGNILAPQDNDTIILRRGDRSRHLAVGELVAMVWMPAGGVRERAALLSLDRNGLLLEHEPNGGLSVLRLRTGPAWDAARALGGYAGVLYLLDTQSKEVLWLPATANGYDGPIYRYLDPTLSLDLASAQHFVVDEDLFLLLGTGRVMKLRLGKPAPFDPRTPEGPLRTGRRLHLDGRSLYVADPERHRIVQFDREGNYLQQLRYESAENVFEGLRDFVVDRAHQRLIIVNEKGVYLLEWPNGG